MQQDWALVIRVTQVAQNGQQMVQIMTIHRADIIETKLFKQRAAGQQPARIFICPARRAFQRSRKTLSQPRHHVTERKEGAR